MFTAVLALSLWFSVAYLPLEQPTMPSDVVFNLERPKRPPRDSQYLPLDRPCRPRRDGSPCQ